MSFIFGRGKRSQATNGLPAATREISSSHGPDTRTPATNTVAGIRDGIERRGTVGQQPSTTIGSLASFEKGVTSPEPSVMRPRAESDANVRTFPLDILIYNECAVLLQAEEHFIEQD